MIELYIESAERLYKELSTLDQALQKKAINSMFSAVAKPVANKLKQLVPSDTGRLKKSIGHKTLTKKEKRKAGISNSLAARGIGATRKVQDTIKVKINNQKTSVGVYRINRRGREVKKLTSQAYKLRFLVDGVKPHTIKRAKIKNIFVKNIRHPGVRSNPVITKAWNAHKSNIDDKMVEALKKWMNKNATRHFKSAT